jgi:hypothetical protein
MKGARGALINITGGPDLTLFEVDQAANRIREEVDPEANIIFGSTFDDRLEGRMRVSVVATGIAAGIAAGTAARLEAPIEVGRAKQVKPLPLPLPLPLPRNPAAGTTLEKPAAVAAKRPDTAPPARTIQFPKVAPIREKPGEDREASLRYVVWERDLRTSIFKTPRIQLARVRNEPHADKLKVFDSIEDAKAAAGAVFTRIIRQRKARRLPYSYIERAKSDLIGRSGKELPSYFV